MRRSKFAEAATIPVQNRTMHEVQAGSKLEPQEAAMTYLARSISGKTYESLSFVGAAWSFAGAEYSIATVHTEQINRDLWTVVHSPTGLTIGSIEVVS